MHFTDREECLAAFADLWSARSTTRIAAFWGAPGQGKSTLLEHLRDQVGWESSALLDLDSIAYAAGDFLDPVRDVLDQVVDCLTLWTGRDLSRYRKEARRAEDDELDIARTPITIRQSASRGAVIRDSPISVGPGLLAERILNARRSHRRRMLAALQVDLRGSDLSGRLLLIDSTEVLALLAEPASGERARTGHWVTHALLPALVGAASGLRIVLAGREWLALPRQLLARQVELTSWELAHSAAYLVARGLPDPALHRAAHRACDGLPGWLSLLVDALRLADGTGEPLTAAVIERAAGHEAGRQWLMSTFFSRIPTSLRPVVEAAAVVRTFTADSLRTLLVDEPPAGWFDELLDFSFVSTSARTGSPPEHRIHALPRRAILSYLRANHPDDLDALHRRAVAYFEGTRPNDEAFYHRFAHGDDTLSHQWSEQVNAALRRARLAQALRLTEMVTAPEQYEPLLTASPRTLLIGHRYASDIARIQGRIDVAEEHASTALGLARNVGEAGETARLVLMQAVRTMRHGQLPTSGRLAAEALATFQTLGDTAGTVEALRRRGELLIRTRDLEAATEAFTHALSIADAEGSGHARTAAFAHRGMGEVLLLLQRPDDARLMLDTALAEFRAQGERFGEAYTLRLLGVAAASRRDDDASQDYFRAALDQYRELEDRLGTAEVWLSRGEAELDAGRLDGASECLTEARDRFGAVKSDYGEAEALLLLGRVSAAEGHPGIAADRLRASLGLFEDTGATARAAAVRELLADVDR